MKILTEARTAANAKLKVQSNSINYLSTSDLKKYLEVANKFLSDETRDIVNYLIVNNDTYISELSTDDEENAISGFYNAGTPKEKNLKELYNAIDTVVKSGRILEIPTLQTKEQFNSNPSAYSSFNIATPGFNNMGVDKGISLQSIANADPKTLMSAANKEKSLADNFSFLFASQVTPTAKFDPD
jgi:hypothetical protein